MQSDYDSLVASGRIETLYSRREKLTLSFAKKAVNDCRFKHWFPLKEEALYDLRDNKKYKETFARTDRLRNSPIHYMRRLLNSEN